MAPHPTINLEIHHYIEGGVAAAFNMVPSPIA
jgi:hypothetical protein